jgi:hypothetical protein
MTPSTKPIVHMVFWKLNGQTVDIKNTQAHQIMDAFWGLKHNIDGLLRLEVGQNCIEHPDAWDISVNMVFESLTALEHYQTHPLHLAIKQLVGPMRLHRGQIDFEMPVDVSNTWKVAL